MSTLLDAARAIADSLVADRRAIHRRPELAFQERQTAALVGARLRELGLPHREGVGATGAVLAGANSFTITIDGRGGHASRPHTTVDPVTAAAHVVTALQTLVSRETPPDQPAVVTLSSLMAGTAPNIIPDRAVIKGTIRAYDPELMEHLERRLAETASGVARALRAEASVEYHMHYPPTINDAAMAELLAGAARTALGPDAVEEAE